MYYDGKGVPQDFTMAAQLMRKAAEQSHIPLCQQIVGNNYHHGEGVARGMRKAKACPKTRPMQLNGLRPQQRTALPTPKEYWASATPTAGAFPRATLLLICGPT